uniref:Uncharacterized protein n=1 Tax=Arundo donax TaxID=35708 RepID=A0A0A8Y6F7_ARUDO
MCTFLSFSQGLDQLLWLLPPDGLLVDVSTLTVERNQHHFINDHRFSR